MKAFLYSKNITRSYLLAISLLCAGSALFAQAPASLDQRFGVLDNGQKAGAGFQNVIYATAMMSDGSLIAGGQFIRYENTAVGRVAKLTPDGKIDTTFKCPIGANSAVTSVAVQPDGKVLIGGAFSAYNNVGRKYLARINTDGSLDTSFKIGTGFNNRVYSIAVQSDGKLLIGGWFTTYNGATANRIIRLESNGSIDTGFNAYEGVNGNVEAIDFQSDGKIIIAGSFTTHGTSNTAVYRMCRLDTSGALDTTFSFANGGFNYGVGEIKIQSDDKIVAIGAYSMVEGLNVRKIARIKVNGGLDTAFYNNTQPGFGNKNPNDVTLLPSGDIIIVGDMRTYKGKTVSRIIRLNSSGVWDENISTTINNNIDQVEYQTTTKKLIIAGAFSSINGVQATILARLNDDWNNDGTYGSVTGPNQAPSTMIFQSDGKILMGGSFSIYNGRPAKMLVRIDSTKGEIDPTFNSEGFTLSNGANDMEMQADGKLVVGGWIGTYGGKGAYNILRLDSTGKADTTFPKGIGFNSTVQNLVIQPDSKIVCIGNFTSYNGTACKYIVRLSPDGTIDNGFTYGSGFNGVPYKVELQANGKLVIGGSFTNYNGTAVPRLVRLNTDGTVDGTFNTNLGTGFNNHVWAGIIIEPNGKILISGAFSQFNGAGANQIIRLDSTGAKDNSFSTSGPNNQIKYMVRQSDGKFMIMGRFTSFGGVTRSKIVRLNNNGSVDASWVPGVSFVSHINAGSMLLYPDNKLLVAASGNYSYQGIGRNQLFRILADSSCVFGSAIKHNNTSCNGINDGSAEVITVGNTGPVTVLWNNTGASSSTSISNLAPGTYKVNVTDSIGCKDSSTVTIVATPALVASATVNTSPFCGNSTNGEVTVAQTGGTGGYSYAWSNGSKYRNQSHLANGTYTITVIDANGCSDSVNITLTPSGVLTAAFDSSSSKCVGGEISLTGASNASKIIWTLNGAAADSSVFPQYTAATIGNYSAIVTSKQGCSSISDTVYVSPNPIASVTLDSIITCNGDSNGVLKAAATGGTGAYTYAWSNSKTTASINKLGPARYSVIITDAKSCVDSASIAITQPAALVASAAITSGFNGENISCFGSADGQATASATGGSIGSSGYLYSWSNTADSAIANGLAAGAYYITVTDTNGCEDSASVTLVTPIQLIATATLDSIAVCGTASGGASMSGTGGTGTYTYSWSNMATTASIAGVSANTYIATITDINSCEASDTVIITNAAGPTATIVLDSNVSCFGLSNGAVSITTNGGTSPLKYLWSNADTTANISGLGVASYSITVTDSNRCTVVKSIMVTQPAVLVASIVLDSNVSCFGFSDGAATASAVGGSTGYNYLWSNNNATANASLLIANNYTVTVTDSKGCIDTASVNITQPNQVIVSFANPAALCANASAKALSGATPTGGVYSGTGVSAGNFDPAISGRGNVSLYYSFTDANNCTVIDTAAVIVDSVPVVTMSALANRCIDAGVLALSGGLPVGGSYSGVGITSNVFDPNVSGAGTHNLLYTFTDVNGCSDSTQFTAKVNGLPVVSFSAINNICLNAGPDSLMGGLPIGSGGVYSGVNVNNRIFTPVAAGTDTLVYTFTDSNGCVNNASQTRTVDSVPRVIFAQTIKVCIDAPVINLIAIPTGGSFSGIGVSGNQFDPITAGVGSYTLSYVFADVNGCGDSSKITSTVDSLPKVILSTILSNFICDNSATIALNQGTPAGGVYSGAGVTGNRFDPIASGAGSHIVSYVYNDGNNCSDSTAQNVMVSAAPSAALSNLGYTCALDSNRTLIEGLPLGGTYAGTGVTDSIFSPDTALIGTHLITYKFIDGIGCQDSASQNIVVETNPIFTLGTDTSICGDATVLLDPKLSNMLYKWSNGDTTQNISVATTADWSVLVTDSATNAACSYSDTINVNYEAVCVSIDETVMTTSSLIFYPNPTNGLVNAVIEGMEGVSVQLHIMNAQGSIVYKEDLHNMPEIYQGQFDLSNEAPGMYFISLTSAKGNAVHRITLNR